MKAKQLTNAVLRALLASITVVMVILVVILIFTIGIVMYYDEDSRWRMIAFGVFAGVTFGTMKGLTALWDWSNSK